MNDSANKLLTTGNLPNSSHLLPGEGTDFHYTTTIS